LTSLNIRPVIGDERYAGQPLHVAFQGELRPEQTRAADAMLKHETGVLSATTAFGKTVVAAWLIAQRGVNALVLVHGRQLLDQWVERLATFLDLPAKSIGRIDGGRNKPTGLLDAPVIQSLVRKGVVDDRVADYGHLIVDECHHLSAHSFEQVVRRAKARFVVGLSATVTRKDGHHPVVFMQCGPIRYQVDAKAQAAARPFEHTVLVRPSAFQSAGSRGTDKRIEFQALYQLLVEDETRNQMICDEIIQAVRDGRSPLVLTERNEHLIRFDGGLSAHPSCCGAARWSGQEAAPGCGRTIGSHSTHRGSRHPGDWQIHRRGIRRPSPGHVVSDVAGLLARNHRAVRRQASSSLRWQARGACLRLRGPERTNASANVRSALPRVRGRRLRDGPASQRNSGLAVRRDVAG
jgi:Type III restriction enzyme, res subunit